VPKAYDQAYFDHWYRGEGFGSPARLERKVSYALAATEYLLERRVRTVLDVGCGEGPWFGALRRRRPSVRYLGVDPSDYAVRRYGRRRNLHLAGLGELDRVDALVGAQPFDLVVCTDVIAYVGDDEVQRGLASIAELVGGAAFIEVFTADDDFEGDMVGFRRRRPSTYRRWFTEAGLEHLGPSLFVRSAARGALPHF
jgi:predicted TPR repeat methyltransferase